MESDNPLWGMAIIFLLILIMAIISSMKTALEYVNENSIRKRQRVETKEQVSCYCLLALTGDVRIPCH